MHLGLSVFVPGEECEGNASWSVCLRSGEECEGNASWPVCLRSRGGVRG